MQLWGAYKLLRGYPYPRFAGVQAPLRRIVFFSSLSPTSRFHWAGAKLAHRNQEYHDPSCAPELADRPDEFGEPTLVVTGGDVHIVPTADRVQLAGELPDAELAYIQNAGHVLREEKLDAFMHAVSRFLK